MKSIKLFISLALLFITVSTFAQKNESIYQIALRDYMNYRSETGIDSQVFVEGRLGIPNLIINGDVPIDVKGYPNIVTVYPKNRKDILKANDDHIILTRFKLAQIYQDEVIVRVVLENLVKKRKTYLSSVEKTYRLRYQFNCEMSNYQLVKIEM